MKICQSVLFVDRHVSIKIDTCRSTRQHVSCQSRRDSCYGVATMSRRTCWLVDEDVSINTLCRWTCVNQDWHDNMCRSTSQDANLDRQRLTHLHRHILMVIHTTHLDLSMKMGRSRCVDRDGSIVWRIKIVNHLTHEDVSINTLCRSRCVNLDWHDTSWLCRSKCVNRDGSIIWRIFDCQSFDTSRCVNQDDVLCRESAVSTLKFKCMRWLQWVGSWKW